MGERAEGSQRKKWEKRKKAKLRSAYKINGKLINNKKTQKRIMTNT